MVGFLINPEREGMSTKLRQILLAYDERRFTCTLGETNSNYPTEWIFIGILTEDGNRGFDRR